MTQTIFHAAVRLLKLGPIVAAFGLLSACGQKGPLILPEATVTETGQGAAQTGDDQQEGDDDESGGN